MAELDVNIAKKGIVNVYEYVFDLEEKVRNLEQERNVSEARINQIKDELQRTKKELDEIKKPPLVIGTITDVIQNKAIVKNGNGIEFLVEVPEKFKENAKVHSKVALTQRSLTILDVLQESKDARARTMEIIEKPKITFQDIGGLKEVQRELEEAITLPLTKPEKFEMLGIDAPKGVLLFGEPGTGKTMLAKAVANQSNAAFIKLTGTELVRKYIGEGATLVRDVFKIAKEKEHAIIFIDELDAIGAFRNESVSSGDREVQRTLMQLLSEIDGFDELGNVKIISATNRIDIIDPALLRSGRFDRLIEVPLPEKEARKEIFRIHSTKMNTDGNVDFEKLAMETEGANGADIKAICSEAGIFALRENENRIKEKHFNTAIEKVLGEEPEEDPKRMFS